jgi:signal transduction histidine kinase
VRDTGSGIPAELYNNIFEPFYRVEANRFLIEGTGIGLTITKSLTEMMNGEIGFESTVGQGSTFWVSFPEQS